MTYKQWEVEFKRLGRVHRMAGFVIGDAILKAEEELGERAYQAMLKVGLAELTLMDMVRIAERWKEKERDADLGYAYYRDAGTDMTLARKLLAAVKKNGWSRSQMRNTKRELEEIQEES